MCNERDRELIRIDFQVIELKTKQDSCKENSIEYQTLQDKINELQRLKESIKAEESSDQR